MPDFDKQNRPQPPSAGDEASTVLGFLDFQRATFLWKCEGLDATALAHRNAPSTMSLGGMMAHLAGVEAYWFSFWLNDVMPEPWVDVDWEADFD